MTPDEHETRRSLFRALCAACGDDLQIDAVAMESGDSVLIEAWLGDDVLVAQLEIPVADTTDATLDRIATEYLSAARPVA